ncbi:sensor domain-containing phosphodiesterase [Billgrantia kenyensis]|uniref:GGDEF and EAL domain-containing protein n=1 Tax=Billgrantia kenyensis TaxID=321266 RepID=A0A7V9W3J7_9GAMM|nr:GGDEF and EAL domain-containing protein [Halomonas kenyensis]MBA2780418.1 GGDEF and EAL domain-containing protein [Halomonas kenyensis]MCG6663374.1 GGDEF and EAL domain-containing protein [Halomonas kenyensis]
MYDDVHDLDYEQARLYALRQLKLLDTPPSESFDRITRLASKYFNMPIAAVSLTDADRQWFKSRVGVEHWEIPRFKACCAEVADESTVLVVPDMLESSTYRDSVLADSGIRFYAGAPLQTQDGYTLGAMCVLDTQPREISEDDIALLKDMAAMVMAQIELQHAVGRIDPLTGLPNRSQLAEDLDDMARDAFGRHHCALFTEVLDSSQVSTLNRVMGPTYVDELSRLAARGLQEVLGEEQKLYCVGLCQFVHLVEGCGDDELIDGALRLRETLLSLTLIREAPILVHPVVGATPVYLGENQPGDVLRTAHSACQDARLSEVGAGVYSQALDASHRRRFMLLADFRAALNAPDQLRLVYQPRIDMQTNACLGVEALLRWRHPQLGEVSPSEFIPLIENTPLARSLTAWVVYSAIAQAQAWHRQKLNIGMSLNVSACNLEEPDFAERLLAQVHEAGLPVSAIELELTETALIGQGRAAWQQLDSLIEAGIRIAIDDFGTGYSSLAYLQDIPAQVVKIDRSFIKGLDDTPRSRTLVESMLNMAHNLGYRVVAEGVETQQTYDYLESLGCNEAQGFLMSRPLEAVDFETWLAARTA